MLNLAVVWIIDRRSKPLEGEEEEVKRCPIKCRLVVSVSLLYYSYKYEVLLGNGHGFKRRWTRIANKQTTCGRRSIFLVTENGEGTYCEVSAPEHEDWCNSLELFARMHRWCVNYELKICWAHMIIVS